MKKSKKLFSMLLAFAMIISVCSGVMAAENAITVNGAQEGETYAIYKMLDLVVDEKLEAYSYTLNEDWADFFRTGDGKDYVNIETVGNVSYVTWKDGKGTEADMEAFGKAAAKVAENPIKTIKASGEQVVFDKLDPGYYLITSTNGTLAIVRTTPEDPTPEIKEKNPNTEIKKEVQEDRTNGWGTVNSAQIGDTVEFRSTFEVKKGAKNYVIHDTMDKGLTFNADSVAIEGLTEGTDYTVVTEGLTGEGKDGCTFEVVLTQTYLDTITEAKTLVLTYDAVLNEKAEVGTAEVNKTNITWGDNNKAESTPTETKTYQFSVLKYDGTEYAKDAENKTALAGATFELKKGDTVVKLVKLTDTEYRVANGDEKGSVKNFTTVDAGAITIKGVDLDEYKLVEITAPAGFNILGGPVTVTVGAENNVVVEVANQTGTELPSTGGMGTTVFYMIGGIMVIGAAVMLFARKRMSAEK